MIRRKCPIRRQNELREEQSGKCAYCNIYANAVILRNGEEVQLFEVFDHFIPHAYVQANRSDNWVLACHVCNGMKSDRMFQNLTDARNALIPERSQKGYEVAQEFYFRVDLELGEQIESQQDIEVEDTPDEEETGHTVRSVRFPASKANRTYDGSPYIDVG
jgi:hypothetical protein